MQYNKLYILTFYNFYSIVILKLHRDDLLIFKDDQTMKDLNIIITIFTVNQFTVIIKCMIGKLTGILLSCSRKITMINGNKLSRQIDGFESSRRHGNRQHHSRFIL